MADETLRYAHGDEEDAPLELNDLLEPFDPLEGSHVPGAPGDNEAYGTRRYQGGAFFAPPQDAAYPDAPYEAAPETDGLYPDDPYEAEPSYGEEYSDYHEELDQEERTRTAIGVFNLVSMLAGVAVILVLVAMLFSLLSWLRTDVVHSITLLQSGIQ